MARSVILLGKGKQACRVGAWFKASPDYDLRFVVPVVPEPSWTDSLMSWCRANDVPLVESGHYRDIPGVGADDWSVDLLFSVFCDRILPGWLLNRAGRSLNLHNAPLPRYRGMAPINWALKNGETTHGVTIHEMTPEIDSGPIVAQVRFSIYPATDEVIDVYQRALAYGYTLFERTMPILDRIEPLPQGEADASYYSRRDQALLGERRDWVRDRIGGRPKNRRAGRCSASAER